MLASNKELLHEVVRISSLKILNNQHTKSHPPMYVTVQDMLPNSHCPIVWGFANGFLIA